MGFANPAFPKQDLAFADVVVTSFVDLDQPKLNEIYQKVRGIDA